MEAVVRGDRILQQLEVGGGGDRRARRRLARRPVDVQRGGRGARHRSQQRARDLGRGPRNGLHHCRFRRGSARADALGRGRAGDLHARAAHRADSAWRNTSCCSPFDTAWRWRPGDCISKEWSARRQSCIAISGGCSSAWMSSNTACVSASARSASARRKRLEELTARLRSLDLRLRFAAARRRLEAAQSTALQLMRLRLTRAHGRLDPLLAHLTQLSPLKILERGYAIVTSEAGQIVKQPAQAPVGPKSRCGWHRAD